MQKSQKLDVIERDNHTIPAGRYVDVIDEKGSGTLLFIVINSPSKLLRLKLELDDMGREYSIEEIYNLYEFKGVEDWRITRYDPTFPAAPYVVVYDTEREYKKRIRLRLSNPTETDITIKHYRIDKFITE